MNVVIGNINRFYGIEIYVSVQSAHVKDVLSFQIGCIGPANDLHTKSVVALSEVVGEFKLCIVVAGLTIADSLSVAHKVGCSIYAVKMKEHPLALPL